MSPQDVHLEIADGNAVVRLVGMTRAQVCMDHVARVVLAVQALPGVVRIRVLTWDQWIVVDLEREVLVTIATLCSKYGHVFLPR